MGFFLHQKCEEDFKKIGCQLWLLSTETWVRWGVTFTIIPFKGSCCHSCPSLGCFCENFFSFKAVVNSNFVDTCILCHSCCFFYIYKHDVLNILFDLLLKTPLPYGVLSLCTVCNWCDNVFKNMCPYVWPFPVRWNEFFWNLPPDHHLMLL